MLSTYCFYKKKMHTYFQIKKKGGQCLYVAGRHVIWIPTSQSKRHVWKMLILWTCLHCTCGRNILCVLHPMNVTQEVHVKAGISLLPGSPDLTSSPDARQVCLSPHVDSPSALSIPSLRYTRGKGCSCFPFLIVITAPGGYKQEMLVVQALARVRSGTGKLWGVVVGLLYMCRGWGQDSASCWVQPAV